MTRTKRVKRLLLRCLVDGGVLIELVRFVNFEIELVFLSLSVFLTCLKTAKTLLLILVDVSVDNQLSQSREI